MDWGTYAAVAVLGCILGLPAILRAFRTPSAPASERRQKAWSDAVHDEFPDEVVGERSYQATIGRIVGGRQHDGVAHRCVAQLVLEDDNPYDPGNAVRVEINGLVVGYLARTVAAAVRDAVPRTPTRRFSVPAIVIGGWERTCHDQGFFGVRLRIVALEPEHRPGMAA